MTEVVRDQAREPVEEDLRELIERLDAQVHGERVDADLVVVGELVGSQVVRGHLPPVRSFTASRTGYHRSRLSWYATFAAS
jgi:hypothetical protein